MMPDCSSAVEYGLVVRCKHVWEVIWILEICYQMNYGIYLVLFLAEEQYPWLHAGQNWRKDQSVSFLHIGCWLTSAPKNP